MTRPNILLDRTGVPVTGRPLHDFKMPGEIDVADVKYMTRDYRERTIVVFAVCYPLAVLAVTLRFLSRYVSKNKFWWDDWLSVTALVSVH